MCHNHPKYAKDGSRRFCMDCFCHVAYAEANHPTGTNRRIRAHSDNPTRTSFLRQDQARRFYNRFPVLTSSDLNDAEVPF